MTFKSFRKLLTATGVSLALLASGPVFAADAPNTFVRYLSRTGSGMLNAVALNATASARTSVITIARDWAKLRYGIQFTRVAATTVDATVTCSYETTAYQLTTKSCSAGACTVYERTYTNAQATSINFELEIDVRGCRTVTIVLSGASAGASDLVSTEMSAIVGE